MNKPRKTLYFCSFFHGQKKNTEYMVGTYREQADGESLKLVVHDESSRLFFFDFIDPALQLLLRWKNVQRSA